MTPLEYLIITLLRCRCSHAVILLLNFTSHSPISCPLHVFSGSSLIAAVTRFSRDHPVPQTTGMFPSDGCLNETHLHHRKNHPQYVDGRRGWSETCVVKIRSPKTLYRWPVQEQSIRFIQPTIEVSPGSANTAVSVCSATDLRILKWTINHFSISPKNSTPYFNHSSPHFDGPWMLTIHLPEKFVTIRTDGRSIRQKIFSVQSEFVDDWGVDFKRPCPFFPTFFSCQTKEDAARLRVCSLALDFICTIWWEHISCGNANRGTIEPIRKSKVLRGLSIYDAW